MAEAEAYLRVKFHLDSSNRLATIHQRYRQTGQTDNGPIGQTALQAVAKNQLSLEFGQRSVHIGVPLFWRNQILLYHTTRSAEGSLSAENQIDLCSRFDIIPAYDGRIDIRLDTAGPYFMTYFWFYGPISTIVSGVE